MRKQDVFNQVSEQTGLDELSTRLILETFFEVVKESLTKGLPIYIRTFGSFIVKRRDQKVGRNVGQNTAVVIPSHVFPYFKPSIKFVKRVKALKVPGEK